MDLWTIRVFICRNSRNECGVSLVERLAHATHGLMLRADLAVLPTGTTAAGLLAIDVNKASGEFGSSLCSFDLQRDGAPWP